MSKHYVTFNYHSRVSGHNLLLTTTDDFASLYYEIRKYRNSCNILRYKIIYLEIFCNRRNEEHATTSIGMYKNNHPQASVQELNIPCQRRKKEKVKTSNHRFVIVWW